MRITRVVILSAVAAIALSAPAQELAPQSTETPAVSELPPTAHPATPDQIREFLTLTHTIESAHKMMSQSIKAARATSAPYYTGGFWDDMEKAVLDLDLVTPIISAYQKYYSQEDMASLISFYKSPVGQRMLAAQPQIALVLQNTLHDAGAAAGRQVAEKHKDEIERLMKQSQQQAQPPAIQLKP